MNSFYGEQYYADRADSFRRYLTKTYALMAGGLGVTFVAALLTVLFLPGLIMSFPLSVFLLVAEVVTVIAFSALFHRASYRAVLAMYFLYAVLTGVSISYIFVIYDLTNVFLCFAATALSFGIMALIGHNSKRDLSGFGRLFFAGLVGLILLTIAGLIFHSDTLEIVISCIGLVLFLGITAFDTQRMQRYYMNNGEDGSTHKVAVYFALQLYLDFINIFFYLIRLLGRSRD